MAKVIEKVIQMKEIKEEGMLELMDTMKNNKRQNKSEEDGIEIVTEEEDHIPVVS